MPAYNFKKAFSDDVEKGIKRQTIRKRRKRPTKVGETLYLYTGMRTKGCRKLGEHECKAVRDFEIRKVGEVYVDGRLLTLKEVGGLAVKDGFTHQSEFYEFFQDHYGLPFGDAVIIEW
jgi:hypothetical protein